MGDQDEAEPLLVSHNLLGHSVQELVAKDLSHKVEYTILVIFAADSDDFEDKSQIECLIATMQVKIANSKSEYVCLKDTATLSKTKQKI